MLIPNIHTHTYTERERERGGGEVDLDPGPVSPLSLLTSHGTRCFSGGFDFSFPVGTPDEWFVVWFCSLASGDLFCGHEVSHCCWFALVAVNSNRLVHLRNGSARTIVLAATL